MDISVRKETFFTKYNSKKTTTRFELLIKMIQGCAHIDLLSAIQHEKNPYETFYHILDITGVQEISIFGMADPEELKMINKKYIQELEDTGRLSDLIEEKTGTIVKRTKENGYMLRLLKGIEQDIREKEIKPQQSHASGPAFHLLLHYFKRGSIETIDKFAPSLIKATAREDWASSTCFAESTPTYKRASDAGGNLLTELEEKAVKERLLRIMSGFKDYVVVMQKNYVDSFSYVNFNEVKYLTEYTIEKLDTL